MRVLDLDMDYFMDKPVYGRDPLSSERVECEDVVNSVWNEDRVRFFLENKLGLSKDRKRKGRVVNGHNEALFFWRELYNDSKLITPFSIIHVDSHADLGYACRGLDYVLSELLYIPPHLRYHITDWSYETKYSTEFGTIDIGDYLLFCIAYGWVSSLVFCCNPYADPGAIPSEILDRGISDQRIDKVLVREIKLKPRENIYGEACEYEERAIPFRIVQNPDLIRFNGEYDYVVLAQSPNYTPENADYIMDVFREYIEEI